MSRSEKIHSVTFSCRMRKDLYASLLNESEKKKVSFNALINSMAKNYDSFGKFKEDLGFIPLSTISLSQIFDLLDEKNIITIARYVGEIIPKEIAILAHVGDDYEKISELFEVISSKFGTVSIQKKTNGYQFTIHHKVNRNFSLYISEFLSSMGKSFNLKTNTDFIAKNIVIFHLEDRLAEFKTTNNSLKVKEPRKF